MVKSYYERFCVIDRIGISLVQSANQCVSEHLNATLISQYATGVTPLLAYSQKNGDLKQNTNKRIRKWSKTDVQNILYLFNDNRSESDFLGTTSHKSFLKHIIHTIFCTS